MRHFVETDTLGLFETATVLKLLEEAGLKAKFLKRALTGNRGLFVAVKK